ncbi:hypothetical protein DKX38_027311 [Salix brachista]|uniref:Uncharacterized protein n=1 Tax=Salix brachista TaxID=2182728 RepID=A0A5N5JGU8_9ROSI|nr:hypothetical protein DKX38_027311 [Salix brachista]
MWCLSGEFLAVTKFIYEMMIPSRNVSGDRILDVMKFLHPKLGNKADLRHLRVVATEDAEGFAEREKTFFMETSVLESMNVENTFIEVLAQIYRVVSGKILDVGVSK